MIEDLSIYSLLDLGVYKSSLLRVVLQLRDLGHYDNYQRWQQGLTLCWQLLIEDSY